ncbi:MAG: hypothetical protein ACKVJX_21430, partial [Verrucomicrobiia bacterium]
MLKLCYGWTSTVKVGGAGMRSRFWILSYFQGSSERETIEHGETHPWPLRGAVHYPQICDLRHCLVSL